MSGENRMYLKKIEIKRFRGLNQLTLNFNKGLNILIGENNAGKTAIIDALRICLGYGNPWKDIYISASDFYLNKTDPSMPLGDIEFHLYFDVQTPHKEGIFNDLFTINPEGKTELQLHFRYSLYEKKGIKKIRHKVWGGDNEGQIVTPEIFELLYFVYLSALRDAVQCLKPVKGNRLGQLYSYLEQDKSQQDALAGKVRNVLHDDNEWKALIANGKGKINEHLSKTCMDGKEQPVTIDFFPFEFRKIVDTLRIQLPVYSDHLLEDPKQQMYFDLSQNGLGYNNLIYTAIVLGDLKKKLEIEPDCYTALLIEEPEAHLHPQLQNIFFSYLGTLNEDIGFQIFITSHSPTITAKAKLNSLIVLQSQDNQIKALSLSASALDDPNKKYLSKFLDVTKSQMFFSNGIILVEGISESLLLPIFSKMLEGEYDIEKKGVELVNINGVAFEHFGKLFNAENETQRLSCRCAILTDDDRAAWSEEVSSRALKAKELENYLLKVELAEKTFEYELFKTGNNKDILISIFTEMHPIAASRVIQSGSIEDCAASFVERVKSNKAKSELAHRLALKLEEDNAARLAFKVPEYIARAIKWVVKGE